MESLFRPFKSDMTVHTATRILSGLQLSFWDTVKSSMHVSWVCKNICNHIHVKPHGTIGKTEMSFESMEAFHTWKEREEESTYSMYVRDQRPYQPKAMEGDVHL